MTAEELEVWLENQDMTAGVAIVVRIAARVWPLTISPGNLPEPGFSAARAVLAAGLCAEAIAISAAATASGVNAETARKDRDNLRKAARAASKAVEVNAIATRDVKIIAARAASQHVAYVAAGAVKGIGGNGFINTKAASAVQDAAREASADADTALQADCSLVEAQGFAALRNSPLWLDTETPLQEGWDNARAALRTDPDFAFWERWYAGLLKGRPLNLNLLREIALIPSEDWDRGPAHIADKIAGIELDYSTPFPV